MKIKLPNLTFKSPRIQIVLSGNWQIKRFRQFALELNSLRIFSKFTIKISRSQVLNQKSKSRLTLNS